MKTVKSCGFTVKSLDEENYTVEAIVSTASVDRDGEVILPSAFEARLAEYKRNPILCWGHPLSAMCESPGPENIIGRADAIEVREEGLWCKFRYAVEENDKAALCWRMMKNGFLNAFSIGAIGMGYVDSRSEPEERASLPLDLRERLANGEVRRVWRDMELVEISHVFVGSNRDALISAALEGDLAAAKILKSSEMVPEWLHRGAVLLRSLKADNQALKATLDQILKRLDDPLEVVALDAPVTEDEPHQEEVLAAVAAAAPALLAACRYLAE